MFPESHTARRPRSLNKLYMAVSEKPVSAKRGMTLIELLLALALIALLFAVTIPAFMHIGEARRFSRAVTAIANTLERARTYAMANDTSVFVGIEEVDDSLPPSAVPQKKFDSKKSGSRGGRIALWIVASRDGTRIYDPNSSNLATSWKAARAEKNRLYPLGKLQRFDGVRLVGTLPQTAAMKRPKVYSPDDRFGSMYRPCATSFSYPLESAANSRRQQYVFEKVIEFDASGSARIIYNSNASALVQYIEIGLEPVHSNAAAGFANGEMGDMAAIEVDGISGAVRVYRP